jgi:hypothetical protein
MGSGGGGQGGNGQGGAGGGGAACKSCATTNCRQQVGACAADMSQNGCLSWLECANTCNFDPQCTAGCDASHASASALYDPVYACACSGQCASDCSGVCAAHQGEGGAPGN